MDRRWTGLDIFLVAVAQVLGLAVAYVAGWMAFFTLPAVGLFGSENDAATRSWGVVFAVVAAFALPGGLWAGAWRRRSPGALATAVVIACSCLALAGIAA